MLPLGFLLLGAIAFAYRWAALGGIGRYLSESGEPSVLQFGWKSFEGILLRGPALTPYLLARLAEITQGKTLQANQALMIANARLAARVAKELLSPD